MMSKQITIKTKYLWAGFPIILGLFFVGVLCLGLHALAYAAGPLGTTASYQRIAENTGGLTVTLTNGDKFGASVTRVGDLNGDGVSDLAVGAWGDDTGQKNSAGAVYILFMKTDGTVSSSTKIANNIGGLGPLEHNANFGISVARIGDLNHDGIPDLAAGASGDDSARGAVYILLMKANGTVSSSIKIAHNTGGFGSLLEADLFGRSVTKIDDLNSDGVVDLAVGAIGDDTGGLLSMKGAVYILFMKADGTVSSSTKIAHNTGGFGTLTDFDYFGTSVTQIDDLNNDGVLDLAVGASTDNTGGADRGAVYILFMKADGTVSATQKIADNTGGFGSLSNQDNFGYAVTEMGDLNGDGVSDIAVGAIGDNTGGKWRGAVYILFMNADGTVSATQKIADNTGGFGTLSDYDHFGWSVTEMSDLNGDGMLDLVVGAARDTDDKGAIYVLFLNGPLNLTKTVDDNTPQPGQLITYTITVSNSGAATVDNAVISDTLPMSITFAGPVSLDPPQAGAILATSAQSLPIVASNVTITANTSITLTFSVTIETGLNGIVTNTAAITSTKFITPVMGTVSTSITNEIYLPIIFKDFQ